MYLPSRSIKKELFGENYKEGVGEYARVVADVYPEAHEFWQKDWLARINNEGDAVSCMPERDS